MSGLEPASRSLHSVTIFHSVRRHKSLVEISCREHWLQSSVSGDPYVQCFQHHICHLRGMQNTLSKERHTPYGNANCTKKQKKVHYAQIFQRVPLCGRQLK